MLTDRIHGIDFLLLDTKLQHNVISSEYHSIVISDDAPTTVDIRFFSCKAPLKQWKLSSHLLSEAGFKSFLTSQIKFFFEINDMAGIGSDILWETFKAYIRGQTISFISHLKKSERTKMAEIPAEIWNLDTQLAWNPIAALYKRRLLLQSQYDILASSKVEKQLLHTRQHFFEQGDKAGKLLAYQTCTASTSRLIPRIKSSTGKIKTDPIEICNVFSDFYSLLYSSKSSSQNWDGCTPLDGLTFPKIKLESSNDLGAPLTPPEIVVAIKSLQTGKSSDPDG